MPEGPCLNNIDRLRDHILRVEFKDKIKELDEAECPASPKEAAKKIISEFDTWNKELQWGSIDPEKVYYTGVDLIIATVPLVGNAYSVKQAGWKMKRFKQQRKYG